MDVALHPATEQDLPLARNLVPYYIHDMSEYLGWPCPPDGRFEGCENLSTYWTDSRRRAFMFRAGLEPAGFAMVRADHEEPEVDYSVGEFFLLRKFRGRGVGERLAGELFDQFPGRWEVSQLVLNQAAVAFWRKVIGRYAGGRFEERKSEGPWGKTNLIHFRNDQG